MRAHFHTPTVSCSERQREGAAPAEPRVATSLRKHTRFRGVLTLVGCAALLAWVGCGVEVEPTASRPGAPASDLAFGMSAPILAGRARQAESGVPAAEWLPEHNTETYDHIVENPFLDAREQPLSTFAIDVDTASYANVRRFLNQHTLPPDGAVRIEELVNYFRYDYAPPTGEHPFAVHTEIATCPWQPKHRLVRVGLKGREIAAENRPRCNLVFLLDVSGSMDSPDKLGLVKQSMKLLVNQLGENDRIAIAVYAGSSGLVLPATPVDQKTRILDALDQLQAGGSTDGGSGIQLAYDVAIENFIDGGANRVILCTDGDFNVGITDQSRLTDLIEEKAASGVYLSVLGFGRGNYKDSTMEKLADKGNGNYGYIDSLAEARKVLVEEMTGTLVTIAKDVKIQVEFNPANVNAYRLIGYENRLLAAQDFRDDTKDAGEIGAGHTVTALYEVVPVGVEIDVPQIGELKYQQPKELTGAAGLMELLTVALRYKTPDDSRVAEFNVPVRDEGVAFEASSDDFRFAAAVAAFGMLLRDSEHAGQASFAAIRAWAAPAMGNAADEYRREFLTLLTSAAALKGGQRTAMR
jgi:Ca-activated chloride channel homolog